MNQVNLVGRIVQDLTLRKTHEGKSFTGFRLAVTEYGGGKKYTNFIDCVAFGPQAENITRYVGKGSLISVVGRLSVRNLQENGNYSTIVNVNVDRVEFLESKATREQNQGFEAPTSKNNEIPVDFDKINQFSQDESFDGNQNNSSDLKDEDEIL